MRKFRFILFLFCTTAIYFSCIKTKDRTDSRPPAADAVIGNYLAMNVPPSYIAGSVTISKTANGTYKLTAGSAPIPSFTFQHDAIASLFVNGFSYLIPKQTSNTIMLDSAYLTLYTGGANSINFTLTSRAAGSSWIYSGIKQ